MNRREGILGLLALSWMVFGGVPFLQGLECGPIGGVGIEWIDGSDWEQDLSSLGLEERTDSDFVYGAFFRIPLTKWGIFPIHVRPEIQVMTPRGKGSSSTASLHVKTRVLQFPILMEAQYSGEYGTVYGFLGPSLNFFLTEIDSRFDSGSSITKVSTTPYYGVVLGVAAGIGYSIPFNNFSPFMELRYTRTLTPVLKDSNYAFGGFYFLMGVSMPFTL